MTEIAFYLGVDAGGTRTRARLIASSGVALGAAEAGPANARIGLARVREVLLGAAEEAFAAAGLASEAMARTAAGIGIAGISRPGMRAELDTLRLPFAVTTFDTDAAIANLGAHAGADGAILVLGTGSIGFLRIGGETTVIGGYGFPISDEASGAALGLSAMRHALRALDGRTRPTPLSAAVTERFAHDTARAVAWMDTASPADYAALAPMVMAYAEQDDEIARSIVEDAVKHVERFIETIFAKGAPRCALAGGLSARLRPWLRGRTAARLSEPVGDPLDGALLLAGYRPSP